MDQIDVRLGASELFCFFGPDESESEPYLWVIGFKLDGSTLRQAGTKLTYTPELFFSSGSHGCLGTRAVRSRMTVNVPAAVGSWSTTLRPLILTDAQGATVKVPGAFGFVAILMEENHVTSDGAEAGHQALNQLVAKALADFITGIDLVEFSVAVQKRMQNSGMDRAQATIVELQARFDVVVEKLKKSAPDVVSDAMKNAMNLTEQAWAGLDKDLSLGTANHLVTADQLLDKNDFTIKFTDKLYDNVAQPESGRWAYNLHSYFKAKLRWRHIDSGPPPELDVQISGIEKSVSQQVGPWISAVGGTSNGIPWWLPRSHAVDLILKGQRTFFVRGSDGQRVNVEVTSEGVGHSYLRTRPNSRPEDNLSKLPPLVKFVLEPDPFG